MLKATTEQVVKRGYGKKLISLTVGASTSVVLVQSLRFALYANECLCLLLTLLSPHC